MRSKEGLDVGKGDGSRLIDDDQIRMPYFISIIGEDKLNELLMVLEDVNSDDGLIVVFVCAEDLVEVLSLLVLQFLQTRTDELEQSC